VTVYLSLETQDWLSLGGGDEEGKEMGVMDNACQSDHPDLNEFCCIRPIESVYFNPIDYPRIVKRKEEERRK